jgi:branched-chain amino acid transport system permease protein
LQKGEEKEMFLQQVINGVILGFIYSTLAMGMTMVFGITQVIHFSHGEVFMIGSFVGVGAAVLFTESGYFGGNILLILVVTLALAMMGAALLGILVDRTCYRPIRRSPRINSLVSAIGSSIFIQQAAILTLGSKFRIFPFLFPKDQFNILGSMVSYAQLSIVIVSLFLMIIFSIFLKYTRMGKALQTVAENQKIAGLLGINVNKFIALTFLIVSAMAGATGVLTGSYYGSVDFFVGFMAGLKAFTSMILGGVGNVTGAVLGGLVIGVAETLIGGYISNDNKDILVFLLLIIILVFRPTGLLGERIAERT